MAILRQVTVGLLKFLGLLFALSLAIFWFLGFLTTFIVTGITLADTMVELTPFIEISEEEARAMNLLTYAIWYLSVFVVLLLLPPFLAFTKYGQRITKRLLAPWSSTSRS